MLVVYKLLNIANDRIGAAQAYWQLTENPVAGEEPFNWTPNDSRDEFARISKNVLEKRVERAVILHPEKRRAAKIFEGFVDYASVANWNDKPEFDDVNRTYDSVKSHVLYVGQAPERRRAEIAQRRLRLDLKDTGILEK